MQSCHTGPPAAQPIILAADVFKGIEERLDTVNSSLADLKLEKEHVNLRPLSNISSTAYLRTEQNLGIEIRDLDLPVVHPVQHEVHPCTAAVNLYSSTSQSALHDIEFGLHMICIQSGPLI